MEIIPKTGLRGLLENWQSDLIAAISVALVALPLGLGIALAAGVPPMAGILSAVVGGLVTTFFRGSHIGINGPGAGLITVVLASLASLNDGSGQALNYVLAVFVVCGAVQVLLGLFRLGSFADIFHTSVIRGIMAAIGIIIFSKQVHIAMGTQSSSDHVMQNIADVVFEIGNINPFVAVISILGLLLLVFHSRISFKLFHTLPAPMWVLLLSIPFVFLFNFFEPHTIPFLGRDYEVGPHLLIQIPDNLLDSLYFPNFSKINTLAFWLAVVSVTLIACIESLASGKAVDKLDPYKRKTNLNKDLIGLGLSTMVSGFLGGLPVLLVIVRSTINIHNNAKTRWSNFFHGALLLLFIFILAPVIKMVPLCALATLLVFTGFKLASPQIFRQSYDQGIEQLIFFSGTLIITLGTNLLFGIFGGLALALGLHFLFAKTTPRNFYKMIFDSGSKVVENQDKTYGLKVKGIANFLTAINIDRLMTKIPTKAVVTVDLSEARLVDSTILENMYDFQRRHESHGGAVSIVGLEKHISSSTHKMATKILTKPPPAVGKRELKLAEIAKENEWKFLLTPRDDKMDYLESFYFFKTRTIESKWNSISSKDEHGGWEIADITFEEGAFVYSDRYKTTLGMIKLPFEIPKFTIEKTGFFGKYTDLSQHKDIDYVLYPHLPKEYIVKVEMIEDMDNFLTPAVRSLITHRPIHHLESNGEAILIFNDQFRLAGVKEFTRMANFIQELRPLLLKQVTPDIA